MNEEEIIHQERRRICYRLLGYMIPRDEIAEATQLSLEEVQEIAVQRNKEKPIIWTKHHTKGSINYLLETLAQIDEFFEEENSDLESAKKMLEVTIKQLHQMLKENRWICEDEEIAKRLDSRLDLPIDQWIELPPRTSAIDYYKEMRRKLNNSTTKEAESNFLKSKKLLE